MNKLSLLKQKLNEQQKLLNMPTQRSVTATEGLLRIAYELLQAKKALSNGEIVKKCIQVSAATLFPLSSDKRYSAAEIKTTIDGLQLSSNSIMRRSESLGENMFEQLKQGIQMCDWYSLALDESTDVTDISQMLVFVRFVKNLSVTEDILALLPLTDTTRGIDCLTALKKFLTDHAIPLNKLCGVTTDGAPAMVGHIKGVIGLMRNDADFGPFMAYHCIIHQQSLCSKKLNFNAVMTVVVKIVNFIRARALNHRQFRSLLEEVDAEYTDIILHCDVRWLSRGKVLDRFCSLLPNIREFLNTKNQVYAELSNSEWLQDLTFLTDLTGHLNQLNLKLQGSKFITQLHSSVNEFVKRLSIFEAGINNDD